MCNDKHSCSASPPITFEGILITIVQDGVQVKSTCSFQQCCSPPAAVIKAFVTCLFPGFSCVSIFVSLCQEIPSLSANCAVVQWVIIGGVSAFRSMALPFLLSSWSSRWVQYKSTHGALVQRTFHAEIGSAGQCQFYTGLAGLFDCALGPCNNLQAVLHCVLTLETRVTPKNNNRFLNPGLFGQKTTKKNGFPLKETFFFWRLRFSAIILFITLGAFLVVTPLSFLIL